MKQFEYRTEAQPVDSLAMVSVDLNALGADGWELVSVAVSGNRKEFFFKRELHSEVEFLTPTLSVEMEEKKKRGRPKGSKNKPKVA